MLRFLALAAALTLAACVDGDDRESTAPPDHTIELETVRHREGLEQPLTSCSGCHGSDLQGGLGTSCTSCHGVRW